MDKILDGNDFAHDHNFMNYAALLKGFAEKGRRMDKRSNLKAWNGTTCKHPQVFAYINAGRWLAHCWCGAVGYVTRDHPIFFCLGCGNENTGGAAVPVVFPEATDEIERILLQRPVQNGPGEALTVAARTAVPLLLARDWLPGQSVDYLRDKNREMGIKDGLRSAG